MVPSQHQVKCRHQQQQSIHDRSTGSPDQPDQPIKTHTCGKRSLVLDSSQGHLWRCAEVLAWDTRQAEKFGVSCKREWKYGTGRESGEREHADHLHELEIFKHGVLRLLRARDFQTNKQTIKQNHLVSNRFISSKPSDLKHIS